MLERAYFWAFGVTPLPSIALYVLCPAGTVQHFGGTASDTASFWCSVAGSGDAYVAFMSLMALWHFDDRRLRRLVVRGNALYALLHFGAFWYWHRRGPAHPVPAMYPAALGVAAAALVAWGF